MVGEQELSQSVLFSTGAEISGHVLAEILLVEIDHIQATTQRAVLDVGEGNAVASIGVVAVLIETGIGEEIEGNDADFLIGISHEFAVLNQVDQNLAMGVVNISILNPLAIFSMRIKGELDA